MRNSLLYILVLLGLPSMNVQAQDPHFSQYYFTPLQINPALTGIFEGRMRGSVSYRDQWSSLLSNNTFRTIKASADVRMAFKKNDFISVGFTLLGDEVGEGNYRQTNGHLLVSYHKKLIDSKYSDNTQFLIAGLKAGGGNNSLAYTNLWFGRQYDINAELVVPWAPNGEPFSDTATENFADLGLGLMWYATTTDHSYYAGVSMDHINEPNISLIGSNSKLYRKTSILVGASIPLDEGSFLLPSAVYLVQGPYRQYNFGSQVRFSRYEWGEVALRVGLFFRYSKRLDGNHFDALIISTALEMGKITLGLGYDVTVSSLQSFNSRRGAFEVNVIYQSQAFERRKKLTCPKF